MRQVPCAAFNETRDSTGAEEELEGEAELACSVRPPHPTAQLEEYRDCLAEGPRALFTHLFIGASGKQDCCIPHSCCNELPQIQQLEQHTFVILRFWRSGVRDGCLQAKIKV